MSEHDHCDCDEHPRHPTVVRLFKGKPVDIDVEIVDLIELIWSQDISTEFSCQGDPGDWDELDDYQAGYISFNKDNFLKFWQLIGDDMDFMSKTIKEISFFRKDAAGIYFTNNTIPRLTSRLKKCIKARGK
jgi:hypothetical protein